MFKKSSEIYEKYGSKKHLNFNKFSKFCGLLVLPTDIAYLCWKGFWSIFNINLLSKSIENPSKIYKKSGSKAWLQGTARGHPGDTPKIEPLGGLLGVGWPQQAVQDGPKRSSFSHCFWLIFSFRFYWIFRPNMTPKSKPKSQKTLLLNTLFLKSVLEPMFYRFAIGLSAQLGLPRPSKFMKFYWKNKHFQPSRLFSQKFLLVPILTPTWLPFTLQNGQKLNQKSYKIRFQEALEIR